MNKEEFSTASLELAKCIKCGTCRSVCPVFKAEDNEAYVTRGKLQLINAVLDGKLAATKGLEERINQCLMCKACTANCPSGVQTDRVFAEMREYLAKERGISRVKKAIFTWLKLRKVFDLSLRLGSVFQNAIFKNTTDGKGKVPRVPIPIAGFNQKRIIPELSKKTLRNQLSSINLVENPRIRVAFFTGCSLNYLYPEAGKSIVNVLLKNDIEVIIPLEQQCCSTPIFTYGDLETAKVLIKQNIKVFKDLEVDAIVVGCSSGGLAWKKEFAEIIKDEEEGEIAQKLAEKTYDISEFLLKYGYKKEFKELLLKVTYHDPCHLNWGQKIKRQPREIIKSIPGIQYIEMKNANQCCGSGGSYNIAHYDTAKKINDEKIKNIINTGADIVLTGCPACMMQLSDGLSQANSSIKVWHTIQILDLAYQEQEQGRINNG